MLIKFDFSPKKGVVVVKFKFATAKLKIETLGMRRRFARVLAFSIRIRRCSVDGRNDTKTISVDANLFVNGAKQLRLWTGPDTT